MFNERCDCPPISTEKQKSTRGGERNDNGNKMTERTPAPLVPLSHNCPFSLWWTNVSLGKANKHYPIRMCGQRPHGCNGPSTAAGQQNGGATRGHTSA